MLRRTAATGGEQAGAASGFDPRLLLAREDLQSGFDRSIAEIARGAGVAHRGRFAGAYRDEFGEFPRHTSKRPEANEHLTALRGMCPRTRTVPILERTLQPCSS